MLSQRLLELLREYWRSARPVGAFMFSGRTSDSFASPKRAGQVFRRTAEDAGINKSATTHALRRSFATHLIELGTDVTVVKALLGHSSLRTTAVYTQTREALLMRTRSPLDVLGTPAGEILG